MIGETQPSITDWIQAIGVLLTLPAAAWGIFQLFIKDKDKERKISALEQLAQSQSEVVNKLQDQVDQLSFQSGQFQYQSSLMLEQNKLLEKQIELQNSIFLHEKGIEDQKMNVEKQKRLSEIRPFFTTTTQGSGPNGFFVDLVNKGGEAINVSLKPINTDFVSIHPIPARIASGAALRINGTPRPDKTYYSSYQVTYEADLVYEDIDKNKYRQNIQKLNIGRHIIREPQIETE